MDILIDRNIKGLEHLEYSPTLRPADKNKDFEKLFKNQPIFRYFCAYPFQGVIQNPTSKMRMADRTVRVLLQLDKEDVTGNFDEDEFDSHLEKYLQLIQKEPIMSIIALLEQEGFIKKRGGKGAFLSAPIKRKMRKQDTTFKKLESQVVRDELVGYRYEKGALIPTPKTGESSKKKVTQEQKDKTYSKRTSDFMDAFDKNTAVIIEDRLKEEIDVADTSKTRKDGSISTKNILVSIDTREYFRKLFIKNGFGDFNDPDEFYFGVRGKTTKDEEMDSKRSTQQDRDKAFQAELRSGEKQKKEADAKAWFYEQEDIDEDDERNAIASKGKNIKPDNVTYTMLADNLDPNWFDEDVEKMLVLKAAPKDSDTALATMGQQKEPDTKDKDGKTTEGSRSFYIKDFDGKKTKYNTIEEFHEALVDFQENEFTPSKIEDMAKKGLESRKENRLKTQVKAYLTPKNNLIEVGQAKINFSMDVTNLESPEALTRYIMSDKNWGEQPFEDGPDTKSTPYEKEKRSLAKIADRVFSEIDNLEKTINAKGDKPYVPNLLSMLFGSQVGLFERVVNSDSLESATKYPEERNSRVKVKDVLERIELMKDKLLDDLENAKKGRYIQEEANVTDPSGNEIWFEYDPETQQYGKSVGVMQMHPKDANYSYGRHDDESRKKMEKNPNFNWVLTKPELEFGPVKEKDVEIREAYEATKNMSRYLDLEESEEGEMAEPSNPAEVKQYLRQLENVVKGIVNALDRLSDAMRKKTTKTDTRGNPVKGEPAGKGSLNWYLAYLETDNNVNDFYDDWLDDWFATTPTSKGGWRQIRSQVKALDIPLVWIASSELEETDAIDTRAQRPESWRRSASGKNPFRAGTRFGDERISTQRKKTVESPKGDKSVTDQYGGEGSSDEIKSAILDMHSIYVEYIELKEVVESAT